MVDSCFEVISFCMAGAVMAVLLKQYCKEQSMFISLGVCALVAVGFFTMITPVISKITDIFESAGLSENYPELIFKSAAICFITETFFWAFKISFLSRRVLVIPVCAITSPSFTTVCVT